MLLYQEAVAIYAASLVSKDFCTSKLLPASKCFYTSKLLPASKCFRTSELLRCIQVAALLGIGNRMEGGYGDGELMVEVRGVEVPDSIYIYVFVHTQTHTG